MGLSGKIPMNLARKMVLPSHVSAFYCFLLFRLMYPSRALMLTSRCMPKYMPKRIASRKLKQWQRMMGNDHPNLLAFLPRLMLLGRNQRACGVSSLMDMMMFQHVDFYPRNLKLLRYMFRQCYESGKPFALEFNSKCHQILVVKFDPNDQDMLMRTELINRLNGNIEVTDEQQIELDDSQHWISLFTSHHSGKKALAIFFYTHNVSISNIEVEAWSTVTFYSQNSRKHQNECVSKPGLKRLKLE